jgi:hypothetical protein
MAAKKLTSAEIIELVKRTDTPPAFDQISDNTYWHIVSCIKNNSWNSLINLVTETPDFVPDLELQIFARDSGCPQSILNLFVGRVCNKMTVVQKAIKSEALQSKETPTTRKLTHVEILDNVRNKEDNLTKEQIPERSDWVYWVLAGLIKKGLVGGIRQTLHESPDFIPDAELLSFAVEQKCSSHIMDLLIERMREATKPKETPTGDFCLQKIGLIFYRLSLSALTEITSLYPATNSSSEAIEFRKVLTARQREEEQAKKAINLSVQYDSSTFLDPYLPFRASTFRYLAEKSNKKGQENNMTSRYLRLLYAKCQPDDLTPNDVVEYHSILKELVDPHFAGAAHVPESTHFVIWQGHSAALIEKLLKEQAYNSLAWISRALNIPMATLFSSVNDPKIKDYKETDLAKLAKTCTTITVFGCFGIRCKKEVAHIEKGNELFEIWRDSLPDESPIIQTSC